MTRPTGYSQRHRGKLVALPGLVQLAEQGQDGRDWYARAHQSILQVAERLRTAPRHVASVLAVTSPRVAISRNMRVALALLQGREPPGLMKSHRSALVRLAFTGEISGPKTAAFRDALLADPTAVVVDVWVARALELPDGVSLKGAAYRKQADRIRQAAAELEWAPAETQAAVWTGVRSLYGFKPAYLEFPEESLRVLL